MGFFFIIVVASYPKQSDVCVVYNICPIRFGNSFLHVHASRTVNRAAWLIILTCLSSLSQAYFTSLIVCVCSAGNAVKRKQSRKRLIIQQPSNGGQECAEVLEEERDCEVPKVCPGFR